MPDSDPKGTSGTAIPIGDIRVCSACCCAICGCNCDPQECFGCSESGRLCCCLLNQRYCKCENSKGEDGVDKCFTWSDGGCYIVMPNSCCEAVVQTCCLDSRCALPCTEDVPCICTILPFCTCLANYAVKVDCCKQVHDLIDGYESKEVDVGSKGQEAPRKSTQLTEISLDDLYVCCAAICSVNSFYCSWPECCGCQGEGICCFCCQGKGIGCKPVCTENDRGICCICCEGGQYCVASRICCLQQNQQLCIDERCAIPCDPRKVPCACTLLPCCICCADWKCKVGCLKTLGALVQDKVAPEHAELR